jgi:hypothetical protein
MGVVIAKQKTNSRGSTIFHINQKRLAVAVKPLRFTTSGGQVIGQTGNQTSGPAFYGHLRGQIIKVPVGKHTIAYLDLISTSASVMRSNRKSYDSATKAVRAALSIGKGFPVNGIRFKNNYVGSTQLQAATEASGGFDQYVRNMVNRINHREKITELTPPIYATTATSQKNALADVLTNALRPSEARGLQANTTQATSTSTYPQCNVPLGNGSGSTTSPSASTEIIEDFGVTSISILLKAAGAPSAAASGIAGMLLTGGATGSPSASALQAVDNQLVCISAQLNYLSTQVAEMAYTIDIESAVNCAADATTQYYNYSGLVNEAQDCNSSTCQLNSNNSSLMSDLEAWDPSGSQVGGCSQGATVNNALFGTGGGQASGWQQLNEIYQGNNAWYTALQVQQLQQTLSYWGTVQYDAFVLTNEYYNYYGDTEDALISAGNVSGSSVCSTGTVSTTPNFCAAMSNIANAYPPNLYSDEIGIWSTVNGANGGAGLAISAYPAGLAMGLGQLGLNPYYLGQNTPDPGSWAASKASGPSYTWYNNQGINPSGQPSAIQQFSNPQALKTLQPTSAQVASIKSNNYSQGNGTGVTSWQYFVNAINQQAPSGYTFPIASEWTNLAANNNTSQNTPNGTGFFTSDNVGEFSNAKQGGQENCNGGTEAATINTYNFNSTIGSYYWQYTNCGGGATPNNSVNLAPVFGVLLGRTWWSAYSGSNPPTSYTPPQPCVPGSTASACNVPAPTLTSLSIFNSNGEASIQLNFTQPSISSGEFPILQYLATCTSTNSSTPITITGGTTPPYTSLALQGGSGSGGYYYSCTMEALNSLGVSSPLSNALTNAPSVPQPPTLKYGTYTTTQSNAAGITLTYVAPTNTGNSPITSYNAVCTSGSYIVSGTTSSSSTISMVGGSETATPFNYNCTVTATNSLGTSQPSNSISIAINGGTG